MSVFGRTFFCFVPDIVLLKLFVDSVIFVYLLGFPFSSSYDPSRFGFDMYSKQALCDRRETGGEIINTKQINKSLSQAIGEEPSRCCSTAVSSTDEINASQASERWRTCCYASCACMCTIASTSSTRCHVHDCALM